MTFFWSFTSKTQSILTFARDHVRGRIWSVFWSVAPIPMAYSCSSADRRTRISHRLRLEIDLQASNAFKKNAPTACCISVLLRPSRSGFRYPDITKTKKFGIVSVRLFEFFSSVMNTWKPSFALQIDFSLRTTFKKIKQNATFKACAIWYFHTFWQSRSAEPRWVHGA
jgi:hypothetical protein